MFPSVILRTGPRFYLRKYPKLVNSLSAACILATGDVLAQKIESSHNKDKTQRSENSNSNAVSCARRDAEHHALPGFFRDVNLTRTLVMASYGGLVFSPFCVFLYGRINALPLERYVAAGLKRSLAQGVLANLGTSLPMQLTFFTYITSAEYFLMPKAEVSRTAEVPQAGIALTEASVAEYSDDVEEAFLRLANDVHAAKDEAKRAEKEMVAEEDGLLNALSLRRPAGSSKNLHEDLEIVSALVRAKVEAELLPTMAKSAMFWIPISTLNFHFVPLHYRVMVASVMSVAWHTILSLVQHRQHDSEGTQQDRGEPRNRDDPKWEAMEERLLPFTG